MSVSGSALTLSQDATETKAAAFVANVPFNASGATLEAALAAIPNIGAGNVAVSGGPGSETGSAPYAITFKGAWADTKLAKMTTTATALTGGAKTATIALAKEGAAAFEICTEAASCLPGASTEEAGSAAAGAMNHPRDVAINQKTGDLYVADEYNERIDMYNRDGEFISAFGWDVNGTGGLETCTTTCKAGTAGHGLGELGTAVYRDAVDPTTGDVLVAEIEKRLQAFTPTGTFAYEIGYNAVSSGPDNNGTTSWEVCIPADGDTCTTAALSSSTALGAFTTASPDRVTVSPDGEIFAVDNGDYRVNEYSPVAGTPPFTAKTFAEPFLSGTPAPTSVVVDPSANDNVLATKGTEIIEVSSTGEFRLASHTANPSLPTMNDMALDPSTSELYLTSTTGDLVDIYKFTPTVIPPPTVNALQPTSVGTTTATLTGEVNPEGYPANYHFEYSTNGTEWESTPTETAASTSPEEVHATVSGLTPGALYIEKLVATGPGGTSQASETTFSTAAAKPTVSQTLATPVESTSAALTTYINPNGSETSYQFEYGTTESYGTDVPAFDRDIGSGTAPVLAKEAISGLTASTTYYFRVAASNASGVSYGRPQTFTTPGAAGTCPNEAVRAESDTDAATTLPYSSQLAQCRAYEMVTPLEKGGALLSTGGAAYGKTTVSAISSTGASLFMASASAWGLPGVDSAGTGGEARYALTRGEDGWTTTSLSPPASQFRFSRPELPNTDNVDVGVWGAVTPQEPREAGNWYLREANGTYVDIGPVDPAEDNQGPPGGAYQIPGKSLEEGTVVGASAALSASETPHVVFTLKASTSLYEYVGTEHTGSGAGAPTVVGVNNSGAVIGASTQYDGISAEGSTVLFSAGGSVFARIGTPGANTEVGDTTVVNVAGSSSCEASDSCNVTSDVTFQGASRDGSRVFFTAKQAELSSGDTDSSNVLYECELPGDTGTPPAPSGGDVNPCPTTVKAISQTGTSEDADVQSVAGVSEDGTHVYYVATGVMTDEANNQGQIARAGRDNLYVYDTETGTNSFIATLPTATLAEVQVTPSGEFFLFTSTGDLTPDDTSGAAQAFRYDATDGELLRMSIGQDGYNSDGNTSNDPVTLALQLKGEGQSPRRSISNNGEYVAFQSSDALTPQVQGGVNNVYLWHDGDVDLISDGTEANGTSVGLIGMDATGENIFLMSEAKLVGQDTDESADVYDARIDGGFSAPASAPSCTGEECQGSLTAPLTAVIPGSGGAALVGNLTSLGLELPGDAKTKTAPEPKTKMKTRAEKLKAALKSCGKDKKRKKKAACEKQARKKYGPLHKTKKKAKIVNTNAKGKRKHV